MTDKMGMGVLFSVIAFIAISMAGWLTHVVMCIKLGLWGFLIAGAVMAPVGVIHGWGFWIGAW